MKTIILVKAECGFKQMWPKLICRPIKCRKIHIRFKADRRLKTEASQSALNKLIMMCCVSRAHAVPGRLALAAGRRLKIRAGSVSVF